MPKGIYKRKLLTDEHKKNISLSLIGNQRSKGKIGWNKGTKGVMKANQSSFKKGIIPWNKGTKGLMPISWSKGKKGLIKAWNKGKPYLQIRGDKHHNWKGGRTTLILRLRTCFKMRQWRSDVFTRDNYKCQICGDTKGGNFQAHHIYYLSKFINDKEIKTFEEAIEFVELWNINNGITLCINCHKKEHGK